MGNPNFGTTPVTLAGVFLPWPLAVIIGLIKGIASAVDTGRFLVEIAAGIGDALMAYFTFRLALRWHKALAALVGQGSRFIFTSGMVALAVSLFIALGIITPQEAPVAGLTGSFFSDFAASWLHISYPAVALSILFNAVASVIIILLFGKYIERFLKKN